LRRTWNFENPLKPEQLAIAAKTGRVVRVGFYYGGDPAYELDEVPSVWHERCLVLV